MFMKIYAIKYFIIKKKFSLFILNGYFNGVILEHDYIKIIYIKCLFLKVRINFEIAKNLNLKFKFNFY